MLIHLLMIVAAAPAGVPASTPLEEVKQLDALLPDLVHEGPKLSAVLATRAEIKAMVAALGAPKEQAEMMVSGAIDEQKPGSNLPESFSSKFALRTTNGDSHSIRFYDPTGKRLQVSTWKRSEKTVAVTSAPTLETNTYDEDVEWWHAGHAADGTALPLAFKKDGGTWAEVTLPAVAPEHCVAVLHDAAKALYDSEKKFFSANHKYSKSFGKLDFDGKSFFSTSSSVESADEAHFVAEVRRFGGVVRINELKAITDVKPCKLTP